jgi:hypothetical protein
MINLSAADRITIKTSNNSKPNRNNSIPMEYLFQTFKNPLSNMKHNHASKKAIEILSNF